MVLCFYLTATSYTTTQFSRCGGALWQFDVAFIVHVAWAVGVKPCGAGSLLVCKLLALFHLLFGGRSLLWVRELGEVDFVP